MQGIEPVIVGDGDISAGLQQHRQHVISLLAYSIMQGCVPLRILKRRTLCYLLLCDSNPVLHTSKYVVGNNR